MRTPRVAAPSPSLARARGLARFARLALAAAVPLLLPGGAGAAEIVLTDPNYGAINASALDQPRLYALISDPANGNAFITWFNPNSGETEPVLLTVFVDTGASGFAISHLHATGEYDVADLGLEAGDFVGSFTEIGIGGEELGDVTRPFGVWVRNGAIGTAEEIFPSEFDAYGDYGLWVRRETGTAEVQEVLGFPIVSPLNLVGMPVIRQRRMLMDPTPMAELEALVTELLPPGAPEPATQATVPLVLRDFIDEVPPPGEVLPSHEANPLVPDVRLEHGGATATGEWLLDTGAGSSFASFAMARAAGLIPAHYATLEDFMADYDGPTADIGGIGATQTVPRLTVERISVPAREGARLVWENVELLVVNVASLEGIFGMNLLVPAVTVDPDDPFGSLFDISPGAFTSIVIDTTDATDPVMRLATPFANGTVFAWLGENFSGPERSQAAVGSLTGDPDADGAPNLLEYALGLDPRAPNPGARLPAGVAVNVSGQTHLALSFERPVGGRGDVRYVVEISNDLVGWRRDTGEVLLHSTTPSGDGARETLVFRTAAALGGGDEGGGGAGTSARVFLRLAVELLP